jgi:hypothetical protein
VLKGKSDAELCSILNDPMLILDTFSYESYWTSSKENLQEQLYS